MLATKRCAGAGSARLHGRRAGGSLTPTRGWLSGALNLMPAPPVRHFARSEVVGWSPEALFAVVSDVGRYSEFVPLCTSSRVVKAHGADAFEATLGLGYMGIAEEYTSRVKLTRPTSVVAEALDAPLFAKMRTVWSFAPGDPAGAAVGAGGQSTASSVAGLCRLDLRIEMQLRAHSHDQLLRRVMHTFAEQQVEAFKRRCTELYGEGMPVKGSRAGSGAGGSKSDAGSAADARTHTPVPAADARTEPVPPAPKAATAVAAAAAPSTRGLLAGVRMDPRWRADVERAFGAHALDESLTLGRFIEACRALGCANLASFSTPSSGALQLVMKPASSATRVLQAAASTAAEERAASALPHAEEMVDRRSLLAAALFVEFDADGNGSITRDEFVAHLWMLTHASEEEKQRFAFEKLDMNRSGKLERADLVASMRRQLSLAKAVCTYI